MPLENALYGHRLGLFLIFFAADRLQSRSSTKKRKTAASPASPDQMATPTKCEEKRPEGANPRTGYRARLLGKETYAYTAPGAMDTRGDRTTARNGAEEKEERTAP